MNASTPSASFYETSRAVSEYLFFHYADDRQFLSVGQAPPDSLGFARRCGRLFERHETKRGRALDLGCAVGRAAMEMSSAFDQVVAIDYAQALVDAAQLIAQQGQANVSIAVEGDLTEAFTLRLPSHSRPNRIAFQHCDAMNLPADLQPFDFALLANLIDRLPDPARCLAEIHRFIAPGGFLAITSPYTWLEEYTPKDNWLGGFYRNGQAVRAADTLQRILSSNFTLEESLDMPFLIREHARKNQYSVAHATLWRKRG